MRIVRNVLLVALAVLTAGSAGAAPAPGAPRKQEEARSRRERERAPAVADADLDALVAGDAAFAAGLYGHLASEPGNVFFSPASIATALRLTYAGARGDTERQMAAALSFTLPAERLHPAANALAYALESRAAARRRGEEGFRLSIVNSLWGQRGHPFLPGFLDLLAAHYGAGMRLVDFTTAPDEGRRAINDWVDRETSHRIQDLVPEGAITEDTRMVLVNAIYFRAFWLFPFEREWTRDQPFHLLGGQTVSVPTMRQETWFPNGRGDGWQAVALPYQGEALSLVVVLPDAGRFDEFDRAFDSQRLAAVVSSLRPGRVDLSLPKFTFRCRYALEGPLGALGMPIAFTDDADFSGMDGLRDLFISKVLHQAFVAVDEAGTEAAAATAVVMQGTGMPPPSTPITVDRPFIFFIRDEPTGEILFLGRVLDPRG